MSCGGFWVNWTTIVPNNPSSKQCAQNWARLIQKNNMIVSTERGLALTGNSPNPATVSFGSIDFSGNLEINAGPDV
jgi:hypothetical protein